MLLMVSRKANGADGAGGFQKTTKTNSLFSRG
jgi:hypothetical protein